MGIASLNPSYACSSQPDAFGVAASASFSGDEFALLHVEALARHGLPLVESGLAQRDAVGFGLSALAAGCVEVDDVGHDQVFGENYLRCLIAAALSATSSQPR